MALLNNTPIHFTSLLEGASADWIAAAETWRWVHTLGHDAAPPLKSPKEERFLACPENVHTPAHREIMLPLRGGGTFGLQGKAYARTPGTVFLFDHYESRNLRSLQTLPGSALWLHFHRRDSLSFNTVATAPGRRHYRAVRSRFIHDESAARIMAAWDQCRADPQDRACWAYLKSQITTLLLRILAETRPDTSPQPQEAIIATLCEYIRNHLSEPLTTALLANIAGYSPFFLHRLFRQETGLPPKAYIDRLRLEKAKEMLHGNHSLEAIAEAVGMASAYSFSRFFRQQTGHPPRQWGQLPLPRPPSRRGRGAFR